VDRPSHDSWGIRKLIFVFSDDFVHRVYRLPLWDDAEWVALLQPVFDACGVERHRIIRCLFASMPPRTVIPVHHDSGYWVPRTCVPTSRGDARAARFGTAAATRKLQAPAALRD
jgi:hypothetical protein